MRLNVGAGGQKADGWTSLDRAGSVAVVHDLTDLPLPFDDESCEGAVAHHVLDLLPPDTVVPLLDDLLRILQPNAVLRISGANLMAGIDAAFRRDIDWFAEPRPTLEQTVGWFITQGGARRALILPPQLRALLLGVGYVETRSCKWGQTMGHGWLTDLDSRPTESFFVDAAKA